MDISRPAHGTVGLVAIGSNRKYPPLSIACLNAAVIADSLPPPRIFSFDITEPPEMMLEELVLDRPAVLGFSCYVWNIGHVRHLVQRIGRIAPDTRIVLGGPEVGPRAGDLLASVPGVHAVVLGEGERPFPAIVRRVLEGNPDLSGIPGVAIRSGGRVRKQAEEAPAPLDSLPNPFDHWPFPEAEDQLLPVETMRGCRYPCRFCYYGKGGRGIRTHAMERVFADLRFALSRHAAKTLYLMDPSFTADRKRALEICRFIAGNNPGGKAIHTEVRAEEVDAGFAAALAGAGVTRVEVGLQSMTPEVQALAGRPTGKKAFVGGYRALKEAGIGVELQLIAGLPGEDAGSFLRSLDGVFALAPDAVGCFRLMVLPGTHFWSHADRLGIVHEGGPPWRVLSNGRMSFEEICRSVRAGILGALALSAFPLTLKYLLAECKMTPATLAFAWAGRRGIPFIGDGVTDEERESLRVGLLPELFEATCVEKGLDWGFYGSILRKELAFPTP